MELAERGIPQGSKGKQMVDPSVMENITRLEKCHCQRRWGSPLCPERCGAVENQFGQKMLSCGQTLGYNDDNKPYQCSTFQNNDHKGLHKNKLGEKNTILR